MVAHRLLALLLLSAPVFAQVVGLESLARDARSSSYDKAIRAVAALGRFEDRGVPGLLGALENKHKWVQVQALFKLGSLEVDPDLIYPGIGPILGRHQTYEPRPPIMMGALLGIETLVMIPFTMPRFDLDFLKDPGKKKKKKKKPEKRTPPKLDHPDRVLRLAALRVLGEIGERDLSALIEFLDRLADPDGIHPEFPSDARLAWSWAIQKSPTKLEQIRSVLASDEVKLQALGLGALYVVAKEVEKLRPELLKLLSSEHPGIRLRALDAFSMLLKLSPEELAQHLPGLLQDDGLHVRVTALTLQLAAVGPTEQADLILSEALASQDHGIRLRGLDAARAAVPNDELVVMVMKSLSHKRTRVRIGALQTLGRYGPAARKALSKVRARRPDRVEQVQKEAQSAMEKIQG